MISRKQSSEPSAIYPTAFDGDLQMNCMKPKPALIDKVISVKKSGAAFDCIFHQQTRWQDKEGGRLHDC
jgi:hypothetical protein